MLLLIERVFFISLVYKSLQLDLNARLKFSFDQVQSVDGVIKTNSQNIRFL